MPSSYNSSIYQAPLPSFLSPSQCVPTMWLSQMFLGAKAPLEIASVSKSVSPLQKNLQLQFLAMTWTNNDWYQIEWY